MSDDIRRLRVTKELWRVVSNAAAESGEPINDDTATAIADALEAALEAAAVTPDHPPIYPDEHGDWKAANEGVGARIQAIERAPKDVLDSLHTVFTRNGIASYTDYPHLAGDIVHWACEMYRQSKWKPESAAVTPEGRQEPEKVQP